ncbi:helix-turn-helix domain-containing protein [Pedobacter petrophilus]|uniref:Helix-turn-helix domain-containing protein n=2 Tax=Pedobacter TaxID=84567 RepID=A0A7K0G4X6_9SPHI|nr:helix-turn-helix domain-containing protein [Pedobacter petrophilus]MRX78858.1 helix-turn-helix domain-containing protein [Pedobacter petrophilus]
MPIDYLQKIHTRTFSTDAYRIDPCSENNAVIEGFYVFNKDPKEVKQLIFNDGFPVLVFLQNDSHSITVTSMNDTYQIKAAWASAGPIKNSYIQYNDNTKQTLIVRFFPGAFNNLFGLNAQYFKDSPIAPFEHIASKCYFNLGAFFDCKTIEKKIDFIGSFVHRRASRDVMSGPLSKILEHIKIMKGNAMVLGLTNNAGVSYKWLERNFSRSIGILPKDFLQLQRFIHAYLDLVDANDVDLTHIAISYGYYDANHFLKDFKSYTGKSPMDYLKSRF